jgi:putative FmdB family regulatory protein
MPVYAYRCSNCGVEFEKQQSFSDQSLLRCPECGKRALKKVYQPVGIVFKGSGFYATDHHSPSGQAAKKADEKAEKTETSETAGKKENGVEKETAGNKESSGKKASAGNMDSGGKKVTTKTDNKSEPKE